MEIKIEKMNLNHLNELQEILISDFDDFWSFSTLKEELEDMSSMIKEDIFDEDKKDEEIMAINEKIKELEQQIVKTIS